VNFDFFILTILKLNIYIQLSNGRNLGELTNTFDSNLNTLPSDEHTSLFVSNLISTIKEKYSGVKLYLIVSGDIADKGLELEFDVAEEILTKICDELNIQKSDILIVPGDHDVNRTDCLNAYEQHPNSANIYAYDLHDEKLKKFKSFYESFYESKKTFVAKNQIVSHLAIDEAKILIIGFNSNMRVGTAGAEGYVDVELAIQELKVITDRYRNYNKVAVFHHNFIANYEDSYKGQWSGNNLIHFSSFLQQNDFRLLLYGNEHTSSSEDRNQLIQSAVSSLGKKKPLPSFKIYRIVHNTNETKLINEVWAAINQSHKGSYPWGSWSTVSLNTELKYFVLQENKTIGQVEDKILREIPYSKEELKQVPIQSGYKEYFLKLVKEKKLFHSGHFHWSETSRAHNWIDISRILNNKDDLYTAKEAIIDIIEKNELSDKFDFIIGLGIEGNILSTRTSVKYNKPYSFLPYSYRYDEHNDYEKQLNYTNDGNYKSVLIITDVVNDGRTIRKLIHKRDPDFFKSVERIIVISLFYTGDKSPMDIQILNNSDNQFNIEDDHKEERINYYFVLDMKVEKCPYPGKNYRNECLVIRENLGCVHNFYDEEKAHKKNLNQAKSN